jgi:DNA ligase (NAD+)
VSYDMKKTVKEIRFSAQPQAAFYEVKHRLPMLSLENGYHVQDVTDFEERTKKFLRDDTSIDYTVEPEIDGLAVELVYKNGALSVASTRGDGLVGENVTPNIRTILSVPLTLIQPAEGKSIPGLLEVRGEVYMETDAFETLNIDRIERGFPAFKNPQNAAEDSLRQLDPRITAKRPLNMFCFGIGEMSGPKFSTQYELMLAIQQWGFRVNRPYIRVCSTISEVIDYCHHLEETRAQFPFEINGAVVKVNQLDLQAKLGLKSKSPRWAFALKFKNTEEEIP